MYCRLGSHCWTHLLAQAICLTFWHLESFHQPTFYLPYTCCACSYGKTTTAWLARGMFEEMNELCGMTGAALRLGCCTDQEGLLLWAASGPCLMLALARGQFVPSSARPSSGRCEALRVLPPAPLCSSHGLPSVSLHACCSCLLPPSLPRHH